MSWLPSIFRKKTEISLPRVGNEVPVLVEQNTQALQVVARSLELFAQSMAPIARFLENTTINEVMHAKAKSDATDAIVSSAIQKLGFDASRFGTFAVEVPHLVDQIFDKIKEREEAKARGEVRGPEVNSEDDFRHWVEQKKATREQSEK